MKNFSTFQTMDKCYICKSCKNYTVKPNKSTDAVTCESCKTPIDTYFFYKNPSELIGSLLEDKDFRERVILFHLLLIC